MTYSGTIWSLTAGVYAFLCGAVLLLLLSPVSTTLGELFGFPSAYSTFLLAAPAVVIGAVVWSSAVERRQAYTYPFGALFGAVTALLTVLFWLVIFTLVWGVSLVRTGGILIAFVLVVVVPAGLATGLPLMYARQRLPGRRQAGG
jgi:hypothetical protein